MGKEWNYLVEFAKDAEKFCGAIRELGEALVGKQEELQVLALQKKEAEKNGTAVRSPAEWKSLIVTFRK